MKCPNISFHQHWLLEGLISRWSRVKENDGTLATALHNLGCTPYEHLFGGGATLTSLVKRGFVEKVLTGRKLGGKTRLSNGKLSPVKDEVLLKITDAGRKVTTDYNYFFDVVYKEKMEKKNGKRNTQSTT